MRIVGGIFRGRVLNEFKGNAVRPTSDMARESLFNILRNRMDGCAFLDLFAGTGAVGIEAYSRGASKVHLNDLSRESVKLIEQNLEKLGIKGQVTLTNKEALSLLDQTFEKYDIVYIDPPYKLDIKEQAIEKAKQVITDDGLIILEDEKFFEDNIEGLVNFDRRKYGRVHLTFFRKEI